MMVILGSLSGVYVIPTIYRDYRSLEHAARSKVSSLDDNIVPKQVAHDVDDFARNVVRSVHNKAKELKTNSSVVSCCDFHLLSLNV